MTDICTGCHARPRPDDAFICQQCGDQWHGDLQAVPGWLDELRVEAMKLSRKTASTGRGSAEPPSPVDWTASRCADEIRWHLVAAIQALTLGQTPAIPDTTDAMVDWLLANEDRMPYREQAGDLTAGLHALIQRAAKLCDRPDEKRYYLGKCRVCEQAMRTSRAMGLHRCCGEVYDIEQAYAETLARLHDPDNNLTQAEAATLLGVTVNAIKQRVKHRGVQPVVDGRRGVWYRLGDLA